MQLFLLGNYIPHQAVFDINNSIISGYLFINNNNNNPVSTRHRFNIHTTTITLKRRRTDVKTTWCAYWEYIKGYFYLFIIIIILFFYDGRITNIFITCFLNMRKSVWCHLITRDHNVVNCRNT